MMDDCSTSCAFAIYLLFIFSQIAWFHAQVDTTHLIDLDYLYSNFIADVDNILYLLNTFGVELGDVYQTFFTWSNLNECTEVHQFGNSAFIECTNFWIASDGFDHANCTIYVFLLDAGNEYITVFLDVDLNVAFCTDLLDYLTTGTDNLTDLVNRNLDRDDARRPREFPERFQQLLIVGREALRRFAERRMLAVLHENQVRAQRLLLFDGGDGEVRAAAGSEYDPDLLPRHRLLHHTGEAVNIVLLDTFVALMAGFIIIPVCFAYGVEPGSGPSLLFITLPTLFNNMAGGRIWGTLFFIFMSFAALSTIIAVFEEILAFFMDIGGWSRKKAVGVNFVLITVLSLPAILGFNVLSGIQPLGEGSNIMDMEDFLVSSNLLPLGSLVFVLFCVRKNGWGFENFLKEANKGEGIKFPHWIRLYMQYILPLIVVIIYLKGYYDMFSGKSTAVFVSWMCFAVLLLFVIFGVSIFTGRKKTGKVK